MGCQNVFSVKRGKNCQVAASEVRRARNGASREIIDEHCAGTQAQMRNSVRVCRLGSRAYSKKSQWPRGVGSDRHLQLSTTFLTQTRGRIKRFQKKLPAHTLCLSQQESLTINTRLINFFSRKIRPARNASHGTSRFSSEIGLSRHDAGWR